MIRVLISAAILLPGVLCSFHHSFPLVGLRGEQLANEFQNLRPNYIVDAREKSSLRGTGSAYSILNVSPLLISNDEVVTVTYRAKNPSSTDWIAAYSPTDVDVKQTVPGAPSGTGIILFCLC